MSRPGVFHTPAPFCGLACSEASEVWGECGVRGLAWATSSSLTPQLKPSPFSALYARILLRVYFRKGQRVQKKGHENHSWRVSERQWLRRGTGQVACACTLLQSARAGAHPSTCTSEPSLPPRGWPGKEFCPRTTVEVEAQEGKPVAQGYTTGGSESQCWALLCSQAALLAVGARHNSALPGLEGAPGPGGISPPQWRGQEDLTCRNLRARAPPGSCHFHSKEDRAERLLSIQPPESLSITNPHLSLSC